MTEEDGNVPIVFDGTFHPFGWHLVKSAGQKIDFRISQPKHMLWYTQKNHLNEISHMISVTFFSHLQSMQTRSDKMPGIMHLERLLNKSIEQIC